MDEPWHVRAEFGLNNYHLVMPSEASVWRTGGGMFPTQRITFYTDRSSNDPRGKF
jgi:hypothetical protein